MCVNYSPVKPRSLAHLQLEQDFCHVWRAETWQDYEAPVIVHDGDGRRRLLLASYGMVPKRKASAGAKRYTTMNARAETVAQLVTFRREWRAAQFCLVPMERFFEPYYADDRTPPVRYAIAMADRSLFAVTGLWRSWAEEGGSASYSFTQLTINADGHSLMSRFHKPGDEKRSLVIVAREDYDD